MLTPTRAVGHHCTMRQPAKSSAEGALPAHLVDAWIENQRSANTRAAYRSDLNTFGTWCAHQGAIPLRADIETIVAFQAAREASGDSPSTLRRRWSALSSFFDYAVALDVTAANPVLGAARPKATPAGPSPTPPLTSQAVADYRAIAAALDPRLDALVSLLVADGLKLGEILALDVDDVRGRAPTTRVAIRRRGVVEHVTLDQLSARAVRRCIGQRHDGPLLLSSRRTSDGAPRRLTRFGADHLVRQLAKGGGRRVTSNELRRFHLANGHCDDHDAPLEPVGDQADLADDRGVRHRLLAPRRGPRSSRSN